MNAGIVAAGPGEWRLATGPVRSSALSLLTLVAVGLLAGVLFRVGVIGAVLGAVGVVIRGSIRTGFRAWERLLAWASWPLFLSLQVALLAGGIFAAVENPWVAVACALGPLAMGLAACLAYMFIDVERYEVARGYKALHDPLKGQRLATELARYGQQVGVPLLASAAVGMVGGFALLNFALFNRFGAAWYTPPGADAVYLDFIASAVVNLLSLTSVVNAIDAKHLVHVEASKPVAAPAAAALAAFKSFFTLVLLQQIFASVRNGRLLVETIVDFWSPHEPIHERARAALPQYGAVALGPLLASLRSAESLTREQREQLPRVLATIGPAAVPSLLAHLGDPNEHVRSVAASTLGRLRAARALPELVQLTGDPSDLVRLSLAEALGEFHGPPPRPEGKVRRGVWRRLRRRAKAAPPADPASVAVPALRAGLADESSAVRARAAASLGQLGAAASGAVAELVALLLDPDETVRGRAAVALGQVGAADPLTVPALAGLLEDPSVAIRAAAAEALGALKGTAAEAVPALVPLLQDRDEGVRKAAADASAASACCRRSPPRS